MIRLQNKLITEILVVTMLIQKKFPELYHLLNETPLFILNTEKDLHVTDFEQYLESLQTQLTTFEAGAAYPKM